MSEQDSIFGNDSRTFIFFWVTTWGSPNQDFRIASASSKFSEVNERPNIVSLALPAL